MKIHTFVNYGNFWHENCFRSNICFYNMDEELKQLLDKVKALYLKYGIKSVTMDDIARELGISKKTLYQHVIDKTDLVQKIVDTVVEELGEDIHLYCNKEGSAIDQLFSVHRFIKEKIIKKYSPVAEYDLRKYYPDLFRKIVQVRREKMYNNILSNLKKGKAEGLYRSDFDEEIIAKLHLSRIEGIYETELFTQEEILSPKMFLEAFIYHIRGIASEKGLKVLEEKLRNKEHELEVSI